MKTNPLIELTRLGQSVWLDNLSRPLLTSGELARLVKEDGVSGVTSNPAIFKNAMTSGDAYDAAIRSLAAQGKLAPEIYTALAIEDIRGAADILRPVYERASGTDGFVSLEVSPHLARDTEGTIEEAARLWKAVDRRNVLIKIPGTDEGVPAVEACLARGININITLLFSLKAHDQVIEAYLRALETRRERTQLVQGVASVASFFLSRIDTKVDPQLDAIAAAGPASRTSEARALRGKTAIANARLAYQLWKKRFSGDRWKRLEAAGARVQKPLWASTSTKDPKESDVKYVEALIGPLTVNTMPEETVAAFRHHGKAEPTLERDLEDARRVMERLAAIGIDIDRVTSELVEEAIDKFAKPFDALLAALEEKRRALAPSRA